MKKSLPLVGLAVLTSMQVSASESDTQLAVGMAFDQGLSAVVELDDKYRITVGNDGGAFDMILTRGEFEEGLPLTWYVGAGAWSEWDHKEFGARIPLGLNWDLSRGWDMYAQIQPELNLYKGPELQIGGALGIKYSF